MAIAVLVDPAVHADDAALEQELAFLQSPRGYLGLWTEYRHQSPDGTGGEFVVTQVQPEFPAGDAGIEVGDRIVALDGTGFEFPSADAANQSWIWLVPGTPVSLTIANDAGMRVETVTPVPFPGRALEVVEERIRQIEGMLGESLLERWIRRRGPLRLRLRRTGLQVDVECAALDETQRRRVGAFFESTPDLARRLAPEDVAKDLEVSRNEKGLLSFRSLPGD